MQKVASRLRKPKLDAEIKKLSMELYSLYIGLFHLRDKIDFEERGPSPEFIKALDEIIAQHWKVREAGENVVTLAGELI
jgi:hypothetical protein